MKKLLILLLIILGSLYPQVIGDIAKSKGFKGIIFESVKSEGKKNIVLFN